MWMCEKNARCVDECNDCQHYIEVEPVRHGKWVDAGKSVSSCKCTACNSVCEDETKYCPNCGAKMGGDFYD